MQLCHLQRLPVVAAKRPLRCSTREGSQGHFDRKTTGDFDRIAEIVEDGTGMELTVSDLAKAAVKLASVASASCSSELSFGAAVFFTDRISDHSEVWSDCWRKVKLLPIRSAQSPGHYAPSEH